jgi:hypothetical protein
LSFLKNLFSVSLALGLAAPLATTGCHSAHVDVTIENRTGQTVRLLEVTYPSASFGANNLAAGATLHNRIQLRGEGPVTVLYTDSQQQSTQITGPLLVEKQQGSLQIVLLATGKADFQPHLDSPQ